MARGYPAIAPLRELRSALSEMRLSDLAVGRDGRNRTMLSAFRARTGRNQPSNTKFIFGPSVWLRGLIQPPPGYWHRLHRLAAAGIWHRGGAVRRPFDDGGLSLGRPLPGFRQASRRRAAGCNQGHAQGGAGSVQVDCVLAVQYGMGANSLAQRIGQPPIRARELLRLHRETYRVFWRWSDAAVDYAMLTGSLHTVFGWRVQVPAVANDRSLRNFPDAGQRRRDAPPRLLSGDRAAASKSARQSTTPC